MSLYSFTYVHPLTRRPCTVDSGKPTPMEAFIDIVQYMRRIGLRRFAPKTASQLRDETVRTVASSHGQLTMDANGGVLHRRLDNHDPEGGGHLAAILRFDIGEWLRRWGEPLPMSFDILDLGYWYADPKAGECAYEPADAKWRAEIAAVLPAARR